MQTNDPIVTRFRCELTAIYGARRERVVLFGSRARGDAAPDSDYDVAVFLKDMSDRWSEIGRLPALRFPYLERDEAFLGVMPYHAEDHNKQTGLMHSIRTEEITV